MNITFRADASLSIGTGHVMRCLTLANALRAQGATCHFITRALPGNLATQIDAAGFDVTLLPTPTGQAPDAPPAHAAWAGVDWATDAAETRAALEKRPDWLVMDHYAFDARWQRATRPEGTKLMVIDDLADRPHACDLLLDQNLGHTSRNYDGLVPEHCMCVTGPRHALLRPEFAQARASALTERVARGLRHLLITMGGVDSLDATSQVLRAVQGADLPEDLRITVVMGLRAPAMDHVRALARDMPHPTEVVVDVTDMAGRMASADLAIGAAGSTTWERCALGLPTIIVQIADNQAGIARALSDAGAALDPGPLNAPEFAQNLQAALAEAPSQLSTMANAAAAICDGAGAGHVVRHMLSFGAHGPPGWQVRLADMSDALDIWHWRHADNAARFFRSTVVTPLQEHLDWFATALSDNGRLLLMVGQRGQTFGHVRLDRDGSCPDMAEISIYLNPACRGAGLARPVLETAMSFAREQGIHRFRAQAHRDNAASIRLFTKSGFITSREDGAFLELSMPETDKRDAV